MSEKRGEQDSRVEVPQPPQIVLEQGEHALQAASAASQDASASSHQQHAHHQHHHNPHLHQTHEPPVEDAPPPPYEAVTYGEIDINQNGLDTGARVGQDGRVNIKIKDKSSKFTNLMGPVLRRQATLMNQEPLGPRIPEGLGFTQGLPPPPMNIVIQIVGSRGDVQPFIALGKVLKDKYNHRVRIATHPTFRDFVQENDLEFFSIGGDPAELMAFMVKNPGLMPGMESLRNGDIGKRRKTIYELINGCWRSCIEAGDGTGIEASDDLLDNQSIDSAISLGDPSAKPFIADAIIANPVSFAHVHIAEKLGIPLHLMFTMPWSPTQAFPHPLANIISSNTDQGFANFISYAMVDMLTWQGLGDLINRFREKTLNLEPVSVIWAPNMLSRLQIPWTYCWSPALIPKPADWGRQIDIAGFYFLNLASNYQPPQDLADFLQAGPPPVYIGFGSIVVDDPNAMTTMIFEAVKKTGQRALVSKGWGGLGADELGIPEGVFMLGNCPHDWLFKRVSCVVHHGGAGTTAAGIAAGCPTVVVPFFGDQPFWGKMTAKAGAGPLPVPYKELNADKLAESILDALKPESKERAQELSDKIHKEKGSELGAESFHNHLDASRLRCSICPGRVAVWRVRKTDFRLSALAATVLGNEGLIDFSDLKLYRPCEYDVEEGPPEPISGGAAALIGIFANIGAGVTDMPSEVLKSVKAGQSSRKTKATSGTSTPVPPTSRTGSTGNSTLLSPTTSHTDIEIPTLVSPTQDEPHGSPEQSTAPSIDSGIHGMSDKATDSRVSSPGPSSPKSEGQLEAPRAMASVLEADGSSRHRRLSRGSAHSRNSSAGSGSRSPLRENAEEGGRMTLDSAIGTARATGKIVHASLKSPMDFTMSLAQGFHNAPKLYGDTTVRKPAKVTDFKSGLKAAGKEFGLGFYDGITGLVTQPLEGAKKEGSSGFMKGMFKGAFGLVLKPGASIWGLPGYTFKGIYMELTRHFGKSTQNYIIAARTAQGYDEWKASGPGERERIVAVWKSTNIETKKNKQKYGKEQKSDINTQLASGFSSTRHLSFDERKELDKRKKALKKEGKNRKNKGKDRTGLFEDTNRSTSSVNEEINAVQGATNAEIEDAIKQTVSRTSQGDPRQDQMIESAIRASIAEIRDRPATSSAQVDDSEDEAYQRAVQASLAEAQRYSSQKGQYYSGQPGSGDGQITGVADKGSRVPSNDAEQKELERVLTQSLQDYRQPRPPNPWDAARVDGSDDSGIQTEDDEDFKKAIEESKKAHTQRQKQGLAGVAPPELPARGTGTDIPVAERSAGERSEQHHNENDDDEELKEAITASLQSQSGTQHVDREADAEGEEEELRRALTASEEETKRREQELEKQKTEDEVVMEYVKKLSLLEEQHK